MKPKHSPTQSNAKPGDKLVTKNDFLSLAGFLLSGESAQRMMKREPSGEAVKETAELYGNREYVPAYKCFRGAYDKVVGDMQRVLARNVDFEVNKLAQRQHISASAAKERLHNIRTHAQQVIDQFDRLLHDLESKPLVRAFLRKGGDALGRAEPKIEEPSPTVLASAEETRVETAAVAPIEIELAGHRYVKSPYEAPRPGLLYSVRDKTKGERIVRVIAIAPSGARIQIEVLEAGKISKPPIELAVDSLARQGVKGWCSVLLPVAGEAGGQAAESALSNASEPNVMLRLDSQNFGRCCADIVRANIKFSTQLIKDVCDGPFRAGNFEQAFLTFEQLTVGFNSAVANSRRTIADGRRALTAEKGSLSGKEIQDRTAAFIRSEGLIHTAEREFSTILEGLRMYLRAKAAPEKQTESWL